MNPFNSILVLNNPNAGKGRATRITKLVLARLEELQFQHEYHSASWPSSLETFSAVFLIGGDGTLNYFINKYREIRIPIAIFKGGSGNDFAWKLYGNLSLSQYFDRVLLRDIREVDAGRCNERLFINGFGIGFDGAIVKDMGDQKKISAGHIAYLFSVIKNVVFFRESKIRIKINDEILRDVTAFMIAVANGERYGGGFRIAPGASLDDQQFDLILINQISRLRRLSKIPLVQQGRHLTLDFVEHRQLQRIYIEPSTAVPAHCDGEPISAITYKICLLPARYHFFA